MSLFKKNKPTKIVNETDTTVNDFKLRTPYWFYRTISYQMYYPFAIYTQNLNSYLARLFQGKIDDGNGDVLDNLICDMARQAERDLDKQLTEHGDVIKALAIRNEGDRIAFLKERSLLQQELDEVEDVLAEIKKRLLNDKFVR